MKSNIKLFILLTIVCLKTQVKSNIYHNLSSNPSDSLNTIYFRENKGQLCDQNYQQRTDILFSVENKGFSFFLKNDGISYQLKRVDSWKEEENIKTRERNKVVDQFTIYRVDVKWLNAKSNKIIKGEQIPGIYNFYSEQCPNGALEVKSYKSIIYQEIYDGIDLKWYENAGNLKYDYLVAAGSDYKKIQLQINGATGLSITSKGQLLIKTPLGDFVEEAPLVKQGRKMLKSKWLLIGNIASFEIENVDFRKELIIDPAIRIWSTYFGGSSYDIAFYNKTDQVGNIYLTGHTASSANIATTGGHQITFGGQGSSYGDAFIAKFNSTGTLQWSTYYGGNGNDFGSTPSIDVNGNVYLVGGTTCTTTNIISTAAAYQTSFGGGTNWGDAFLVKFNASGVRLWGTYFGGSGDDFGDGSTVDASGNIYMVGVTQTTLGTMIATPGSHQSLYGGGTNDGFIAKFSPSGTLLWSSYYGGSGEDWVNGCVCDNAKNVYFTGYSGSSSGTVIATAGSHQQTYNGGSYDGLIVKFDSTGTRQWGTYYGGSNEDVLVNIAISNIGDLFIGGFTSSNSSTTIASPSSHQSTYGGGSYDCFLAKFNSSGNRIWATYYGGIGSEMGAYCAVDPSGNSYIAGRTTVGSPSLITTPCSYQPNYGGGSTDLFLVKFDPSGTRMWGTYYGGSGTEDFPACSCDGSGNIYLSAPSSSSSGTIMASPGSYQPIYGGGLCDAFLTKFDGCIPVSSINTTPTQNLTVCSNNSTVLTATLNCWADWFNVPSGGSSLFSGSAFTTPNLSANTTYYIEEKSCGISAPRTPVTVTVQICTNLETFGSTEQSVLVYPNPSRDKMFIECKGLCKLSIFNSIGQQVSEILTTSSNINNINVSELPSGVYLLHGTIEDKVFRKKIVIEK